MNRRQFTKQVALGTAALAPSTGFANAAKKSEFKFRYIVGSSMYGKTPLSEILPDVRKTGAAHIDIWPKVHGNQREQMEELGHDKFATMLKEHKVKLGCLTHYDLGPFRLGKDMAVAKKFGCKMMVCGGSGPKKLKGDALKAAVRTFADKMKPHLEVAEEHDVTIAIENHGNNVIDSPDSLRWLMEFRSSKNMKIAFAPYHFENLGIDAAEFGRLIEEFGNDICMYYAWQHGMGCHKKLPKEQELLQMPGRGDLDFGPTVAALKKVNYRGFTQIFMHPVPRGIPILPTAKETTAEINRGRAYLEKLLKSV
ncbi:MAG: xylose isomerase [Verrucomicrobiales bacterium]|nr:xylose isomerase [Verrucomicrobiales bacterium]|tara:strand:+ start:1037 stop:1966 length:930 start_codon:yes stop_codon:yes gene_type:complete